VHRLQQAHGALHVLLVRVQRLLHRHPGVLEPGEVHHGLDLVLDHRLGEELLVEDRRVDEGHALGHELAVAARQVVDHDGLDPGEAEGTHDVRTDVPGTAGHEDSHGRNPLRPSISR
jgi:hypothetical protein